MATIFPPRTGTPKSRANFSLAPPNSNVDLAAFNFCFDIPHSKPPLLCHDAQKPTISIFSSRHKRPRLNYPESLAKSRVGNSAGSAASRYTSNATASTSFASIGLPPSCHVQMGKHADSIDDNQTGQLLSNASTSFSFKNILPGARKKDRGRIADISSNSSREESLASSVLSDNHSTRLRASRYKKGTTGTSSRRRFLPGENTPRIAATWRETTSSRGQDNPLNGRGQMKDVSVSSSTSDASAPGISSGSWVFVPDFCSTQGDILSSEGDNNSNGSACFSQHLHHLDAETYLDMNDSSPSDATNIASYPDISAVSVNPGPGILHGLTDLSSSDFFCDWSRDEPGNHLVSQTSAPSYIPILPPQELYSTLDQDAFPDSEFFPDLELISSTPRNNFASNVSTSNHTFNHTRYLPSQDLLSTQYLGNWPNGGFTSNQSASEHDPFSLDLDDIQMRDCVAHPTEQNSSVQETEDLTLSSLAQSTNPEMPNLESLFGGAAFYSPAQVNIDAGTIENSTPEDCMGVAQSHHQRSSEFQATNDNSHGGFPPLSTIDSDSLNARPSGIECPLALDPSNRLKILDFSQIGDPGETLPRVDDQPGTQLSASLSKDFESNHSPILMLTENTNDTQQEVQDFLARANQHSKLQKTTNSSTSQQRKIQTTWEHTFVVLKDFQNAPSELPLESTSRKPAKRKGPLGEDSKESTNEMRKIGSCLRCRISKIKCTPGVLCEPCIKTASSPLASMICVRYHLRDFVNIFLPIQAVRPFTTASIDRLMRDKVSGFSDNQFEVCVSSGPKYKPIRLTVHIFHTSDKSLLAFKKIVTNDARKVPTFVKCYSPPISIKDAVTQDLRSKLTAHISEIIKGERNYGEVSSGSTCQLSWDVHEVVRKYQHANSESSFLRNILMLHAMQFFMTKSLTISRKSSEHVLRNLARPLELEYSTNLSVRLINIQVKHEMRSLISERYFNVLEQLEKSLRPKELTLWASNFCCILILCMCAEMVQTTTDLRIVNALDDKANPSSRLDKNGIVQSLDDGIKTFRDLDDRPIRSATSIFHAIYRTYKPKDSSKREDSFNPIRDGVAPVRKANLGQDVEDLVTQIRRVISNHENAFDDRAATPSFNRSSDSLGEHTVFRKRNSGRLVAGFLTSLLKQVYS